MIGNNEVPEVLDTLYPGDDYRFVKKPLDNNEIKQAVKEAVAQYKINTDSKRHEVYR